MGLTTTERRVTNHYEYTVILEPQAEGGFTVTVPALPEVVTEGDTEAEALSMAEEAIRAIIAYRQAHGLPIPRDVAPQFRKVSLAA
jgi:antitoxin HicB